MRGVTVAVAVAVAVATAVLATACGSSDAGSAAPPSPSVAAPSPAATAPATSLPSAGDSEGSQRPRPTEVLRGTLGGDAQLEGGCTWLDTESGERVQVLYPEGYEVSADPVRLVGPDGAEVAVAGDPLEIDVAGRPDLLTICQVGPVVEASAVRPG